MTYLACSVLKIRQLVICFLNVVWQRHFGILFKITNVNLGSDFESVAKLWINQKRHGVTNICTYAVFWSLRKLRNDLCFQGVGWTGMDKLLRRCARLMREWKMLNKAEDAQKLEVWVSELERRSFFAAKTGLVPKATSPGCYI
jgi:hypothetical protein